MYMGITKYNEIICQVKIINFKRMFPRASNLSKELSIFYYHLCGTGKYCTGPKTQAIEATGRTSTIENYFYV